MLKYLLFVFTVVSVGAGIWRLNIDGYFSEKKVLGETTSNVENRILSLERRVYQLEKTTGLIKSKSTGTKEFSVVLNGGAAEAYDWTKVPGSEFSFDVGLYGGTTTVTWEGWMNNGLGYARIYDNTNHRAVDGSEVVVSSGSKASFYSKPMSIWRGQNQYHIEIKSISGQVTITQPRLKVIVK